MYLWHATVVPLRRLIGASIELVTVLGPELGAYVDAALQSELFTQHAAFLEKPFPPDELAHKVRQLLDRPRIDPPVAQGLLQSVLIRDRLLP